MKLYIKDELELKKKSACTLMAESMLRMCEMVGLLLNTHQTHTSLKVLGLYMKLFNVKDDKNLESF